MIVRTVALVAVLALAAPGMLEAREQWGSYGTQQAYNEGYQRGVRTGEDDGRRSESFNYADESDYRRANAGYRREYTATRSRIARSSGAASSRATARATSATAIATGGLDRGRTDAAMVRGRTDAATVRGRMGAATVRSGTGTTATTGTISRFRPGSTTATNAGSTTGAIGAATIRLRRAGIATGTAATTGATARATRTRSCIATHSGRATSVGTWTAGPTLPVTVRGGRSSGPLKKRGLNFELRTSNFELSEKAVPGPWSEF